MLTWRDLLSSAIRLYRLSFRLVFHKKLIFMTAGILVYYGILYTLAVVRPGEGFSVRQALHVLVEIPGAVLAIYLTMDLVAGERDRNTLEVLFSASMSHYKIWVTRMLAVYVVLLVTLVGMSTLSYYLFAEFPFLLGGLNAFLPAFLIASLTFFFSVTCRSGNAAGMLSLGVLVLILITSDPDILGDTVFFVFLNPFDPPMGMEEMMWDDRVLINRLGILATGCLLLFLGLRRMERRERLLN
jgi:ABC-type transport system involved in multi-copper enzyme maturation permease subunit